MKRNKERAAASTVREPVRAYFSRESGTSQPRSPSEMLEPLRAPEPPRGRKTKAPRALGRTARTLNAALTFLLAMLLLIGGAYLVVRHEFDKAGPLAHSTVIVIPKGSGMNAIAERLERDGIISDSRAFTAAVLYFRANSKLKAGEYEIRKGASMRQVLDTLVEGKTVLSKVTVPEGLTSFQIVAILNKEELLQGEITEIPLEGTLLPETYKFAPGSQRGELIDRMRDEHKRYVEKLWETRAADLPYKTPEEAIVLASLVEKETGKADERDRIAGVFLNRLRKKMRLQSDPTIIYHLTGGKGPLGRPILKSELQALNPYNTYRIDGLPPTAICNPGRAAIEAVLNPAATTDIYFVADGTGGHSFAETIRDHQNNVRKWRQIEKNARVAAAKDGAGNDKELSAGPGVALEEDAGLTGVSVDAAAEPAADAAADDAASVVQTEVIPAKANVDLANAPAEDGAAAGAEVAPVIDDAAASLTEAGADSVPLPSRKPKP